MEFIGTITKIYPMASGTSKNGNEWKSLEFLIASDDKFPKSLCLTLLGDNCTRFNIEVGQKILAKFDGRAKEWNERAFNTLVVWDIVKTD